MPAGNTTGVNDTSGFQSLDASAGDNARATSAETPQSSPGVLGALKDIPGIMTYLQANQTFFFVLLSVVGYIIIAAFGGMNTLGQYVGYLFFLALAFSVYMIVASERIFIGILALATILLLGVVAFQNRNLIPNTNAVTPPSSFEAASTTAPTTGTSTAN